MKVAIIGSRKILDLPVVVKAVAESGYDITHVISGGAPGIDSLAVVYAKENYLPYTVFPANWPKYGKAAGPIRNQPISEMAECAIAITPEGYHSRGTENCIAKFEKQGKPVYRYYAKEINIGLGTVYN